jgi:heptosyltransferase-1
MKSILIVKTSAIGDVIQTFPVLEYLRRRFPHARIDWAVESGCAALLSAHPLLDNVLCLDSRSWRKAPLSGQTWADVRAFRQQLVQETYDVLFDLQGNSKSAFVTALAKAKHKVGFGWKTVAEKPNLLVTHKRIEVPKTLNVYERYLTLVQTYLEDQEPFVPQGVELRLTEEEKGRLENLVPTEGPRLMVAFGSKWRNKQLEEETLKQFVQLLAQEMNPSFVFIFGDAEEKRVADRLADNVRGQAVGDLSLPLWQALMNRMDGVIAMDSAALHLCATTKTPTFSLFGPSSAEIYKPPGDHHHALQGACPYKRAFSQRCPILRTCPTGACLRTLSAQRILEELVANFKLSKNSISAEEEQRRRERREERRN